MDITYTPKGRAKNVVWTLWDFKETALIDRCVELGHATYCVYQEEVCPKTGKHHLQGYTEFVKQHEWTKIRKLFGLDKMCPVHFAVRRGTPQQASDYCKKAESRADLGLMHESGVITPPGEGQGKRNDLLVAKELIDSGASMKQVADACFGTFVRLNKGLHAYKVLTIPERNRNTICFVLYGVANAGKTEIVKQLFGANAVWITPGVSGVWYDAYENQPVVVFDEFKGWMPFTLFKRIVDSSPLHLDAKSSSRVFNSRIVVFLANDHPDEWYHELKTEDKAAMQRRLHFVFEAVERRGPADQHLGFACHLKKCMLPWNAHVADDWNIPGLSHDESLEVLQYRTTVDDRFSTLQAKSKIRFMISDKSEGVILTPSLHRDKSFFDAVRLIYEETMGQDPPESPTVADVLWNADDLPVDNEADRQPSMGGDYTPLPVDESESSLTEPPELQPLEDQRPPPSEPRSVKNTRHDQLYKRSVFKSNYPELTWDALNDLKAKRHVVLPKPARKVAKKKSPFIIDECEVSGDDCLSDDETSDHFYDSA